MIELFKKTGFNLRRCTWEITLACDLRCGHCGSRAGRPREDELSTEEAFAVIDDLARLGCRHVSLAGGEPTLREDWPELVRRLRSRGVRASLVSNGMSWTPAKARLAREIGVHRMGFSVDGLEATHNRVRRAKDGFARVLRSIDLTRAAGIDVVALTHFTRKNLHELEPLHEVLHEHDVAVWQVQLGVPAGNMCDRNEDLILTDDEILDLIPRIAALRQRGRIPDIAAADNVGYFGDPEPILRPGKKLPFFLGCRAGINVCGIESHGAVKGCLSLPSHMCEGNVRERSLYDIWNDPETFAYTRQFTVEQLHGPCASCEYGEICRGGCTWTAVSHYGKPGRFPQCYHQLSTARAARAPAEGEKKH